MTWNFRQKMQSISENFKANILIIVCNIPKIVCNILNLVCNILKTACNILKIVCNILKIIYKILKIVCKPPFFITAVHSGMIFKDNLLTMQKKQLLLIFMACWKRYDSSQKVNKINCIFSSSKESEVFAVLTKNTSIRFYFLLYFLSFLFNEHNAC